MLVTSVESYLKENIDVNLTIKSWTKMNDFPIVLRGIYNFYEMTILEARCILLEVVGALSIDQLQKHMKQIKKITDLQTVLFYKEITRYRRKSLIENKIAFVIEDGQMYLPFLGLDLKKAREYRSEERRVG